MAEPYEARRLPELPGDPSMAEAFTELMVAVAGFPHQEAEADALAYGLRWLRAHPDLADVLLGRASSH